MNIIESLRAGITTHSGEQTQAIATELATVLPESCVLALHGDLGVGKSTFVSGLARAWSINQPTTSPTFNLFHVYEGTRKLVHLDAYRLNSAHDMDALMIEDFLHPPFCLAIEWAKNIQEWMPEDAWKLELSIQKMDTHMIKLI